MYNSLFDEKYFGRGYVVFEHETNIWWLRFLKSGFRHCYLLLELPDLQAKWLEINPMSNQVCVYIHSNLLNFDYIRHLQKNRNINIVPVEFQQAPFKMAPLAPFTCVEFVKRVLGIHKFGITTPYRLYKYLTIT